MAAICHRSPATFHKNAIVDIQKRIHAVYRVWLAGGNGHYASFGRQR